MTLTPSSGPRDDGNGNQTKVAVSVNFGTTPQGVSVWWDVQDGNHQISPVDTPTFNSDGSISFHVAVPLYMPATVPVRPGTHSVIVCGTSPILNGCSTVPLTATFTIPRPTASLSKVSGRQGDGVLVNGSGFSPARLGETVRVVWDPGGSTQAILYANQPGSSTFQVSVVIPNVPAKTYTMRVCDVPVGATGCNLLDSATTQFTVLSPIVTLDHSSGLPGATFNVSGRLFHPQRELHLYFGTSANPVLHEISPTLAKTTNSDGFFGPYPESPTDSPGNYLVTACTFVPTNLGGVCDPNDTATAAYSILPPPTPAPSPTPTPAPTPTATPRASATPAPTGSAAPTATPSTSPTATASALASPTGSLLPTESAGVIPTVSPAETATALPTSSASTSAASTGSAIAGVEATPAATDIPSPSPSAPTVVLTWPEHLGSIGGPRGVGDLTVVGESALLALLIAFLVPFPGALFNKTVEANYAEIQGWFGRLRERWNQALDRMAVGPFGKARRRVGRLLTGRAGVLVFLALSALVYGFLSPTFGFDWNSAALFLGLLVGLGFITAAFDLPLRIYHRRRAKGDAGVLRALWWTLAAALICVAVSRLAGFQPGYLYGLIISIVFVTEISARDEGIGTWLASLWLLVLSFVAWIALTFVRQASADPWLSLFLQTVLVTFVVAGIETLAIGLLPMRFLPGHPLFRWRKSIWFALFALSVFGYLLILVDPANGYLSDDSRTPMLVGIIFLVVFGVVSIGTWAYFRYRPARVGGDRPGEAEAS